MSTKFYPSDIAERTRVALEAWRSIDPSISIGDRSIAVLEADLAQIRTIYVQIDSLDAQLIDLRNQRDAMGIVLWEKIKRLRIGVTAIYGDDSSEYEMVDGKRLSDRKPVTRKKMTA